MNFYYEPADCMLQTIGEIDWSSGSYEFDLTVVWKRDFDDRFVYAEDAGCSCPSPFDDKGLQDLTLIPSLSSFAEHLAERNKNNYDGPRDVEIAELLERMSKAGAR